MIMLTGRMFNGKMRWYTNDGVFEIMPSYSKPTVYFVYECGFCVEKFTKFVDAVAFCNKKLNKEEEMSSQQERKLTWNSFRDEKGHVYFVDSTGTFELRESMGILGLWKLTPSDVELFSSLNCAFEYAEKIAEVHQQQKNKISKIKNQLYTILSSNWVRIIIDESNNQVSIKDFHTGKKMLEFTVNENGIEKAEMF